MKKIIYQIVFIVTLSHSHTITFSQNVGINIATPIGKLHIKGSSDASQLIIDANATQSNLNPLIRLRKSNGMNLLSIHSDDSTNCFIGLKAGLSNNASAAALNNAFIGYQAGYLNTTGHDNTAIGSQALYSNTRASQNTAIGKAALGTQSYDPGFDWSTGNVAVGNAALLSNQPTSPANGVGNSAVGWSALRFNTTGMNNTAFGFGSLYTNTTASKNTALGMDALRLNTTAGSNTAIGQNALYSQSYSPGSAWSSWNVAIGLEALYANQPTNTGNGISNTAVGTYAMHSNTTGFNNIAIGTNTMASLTTGNQNTACGTGSLYNNVTGSDNTALGYGAGTASGSPATNNTIGIGNNGNLITSSNYAYFGNLSTTWNGGNMTWSTYSDARIKNHIQEDVVGLNFINRLRPVTYYKSIEAMRVITGNNETADYPEKYDVEKIRTSGFLAQEVNQAAKDAGYDFSGITIPKNDTELYSLSYEQFVVPLVKGMQEQQTIIEKQQSQIDELKSAIGNMQLAINNLQSAKL
jgi:hypothetical protein